MPTFKSYLHFVAGCLCTAVLVAAGVTLAQQAPANPPQTPARVIPYDGYVEYDGRPWAGGPVAMEFAIFLNPEATGTPEWTESRAEVAVHAGQFAVELGSITPIPSRLFSRQNLYVAVTVDGIRLSNVQQVRPVPFAVSSTETSVPIGGIIDWWAPSTSWPVPVGYVICDGRTLVDPESPMNGATIPDLRNLFTRGVGTLAQVGIGGSDTHNHTFSAPSHTHSVAHDHPSTTSSAAGAHDHVVSSFIGNTWNDGRGNRLINWGDGHDTAGSGYYSFTVGPGDRTFFSSFDGSHSHNTDVPNFTGNSGANSDSGTTVTTTTVNNIPRYYGLVKLMRVR